MSKPSDERLIIIGAGISGLSAGVHAARAGYDVEILEHHTAPGGVCTAWTREPYVIDGCIHWLMGSKPGEPFWSLYEEVGATEGVSLRPLDVYSHVHDELTDVQLTVGRDLDEMLIDVEAISPGDLRVFRELVDAARRLGRAPKPVGADAPEALGPWGSLAQLWRSRKAIALMMRHMEPMEAVAARVRHPGLQYVLRSLFLPQMPSAFVITVLDELSRGTLATVNGGSRRFSEAIARRFASLGGTIRYGADVEEILVKDHRAVGVRLIDGTEHRAGRVISTAPGFTTIFHMLGGRYTDARIRERYATWPTFQPLALVSYGARRRWYAPDMLKLRLRDPFPLGPGEVGELSVRNMAYDPSLAPEGHSVLQVLLETNYDLWHDLHHAPRRYQQLKAEMARQVTRRLERWFPGIGAATELTDVATPYTFWRYARTWRGAFEGWLPTSQTVKVHPSKTLPGLDGFYMAGQWVEPGGGVPTAVKSGRQVVQILCEAEGRAFGLS